MWKKTSTILLLIMATLVVSACSNKEDTKVEDKPKEETKSEIVKGEIDETYKPIVVDGFKLELQKTSVKNDVLTLHLKVTNQNKKATLFDAFVLNVSNADGKELTISPQNNLSETIKADKTVKGTISFTAAGKGPFKIVYDNLNDQPKDLWTVER